MSRHFRKTAANAVAATIALALGLQAVTALAQPYPQPPPAYDRSQGYGSDEAPPPGQYAPPAGGPSYDPRAEQYDRDYADRYQDWAARYCIDRRNNNTAAGAVIGGVLGALVGSSVAGHHDRGEGAVVGGLVGAGAGAAIGSSSNPDSSVCPPGYAVAPGAPAFAYAPPAYAPVVVAPAWYNPWVFAGGRWTYRPYRYWYYGHPDYWRGRGRDRYERRQWH